jgi:hypothetical protein
MVTLDLVTRGHRAAALGTLGAVAFLAVGVWGIVNLLDGDWFIGGLFLGCMLLGLSSLTSTVRSMRRKERAASAPKRTARR